MVQIIKQNFKKNKLIYENVKKLLEKVLGLNYLIDHVGSTAIPNMYGKNIIDILIGVKDYKEFDYVADELINLGYFKSKKNNDRDYQFFSSTQNETSSGDIHLHLGMLETERYNDFIILKKYLLSNEDEKIKYSNFKQEIVNKKSKDRKEYKKIKSEYVTNLIYRAKMQLK